MKRRKSRRAFRIFIYSYFTVLLIPIIAIGGFAYPRMMEQNVRRVEGREQSMLTQVADNMERELFQVYSLPSGVFHHKRILLGSVADSPISLSNARDDLTQMIKTNTFIELMMLYLRETDYFLSTHVNSFYYSDLKNYKGAYQLSFGDLPLEALYEMVENLWEPRVIPLHSVAVSGNVYSQMLLFAMPVPAGAKAMATLLVFVPTKRLENMVHSTLAAGGQFIFLQKDGSLIHSTATYSPEDLLALRQATQGTDMRPVTQRIRLSGCEYMLTASVSERCGWRFISLLSTTIALESVYRLRVEMLVLFLWVVLLGGGCIYFAMRKNYRPLRQLSNMAEQHIGSSGATEFDNIQHMITDLRTENCHLGQQLDESALHLRDELLSHLLICIDLEKIHQTMVQLRILGVSIPEGKLRLLLAEYSDRASAEAAEERIKSQGCVLSLPGETAQQLVCILSAAQDLPGYVETLLGTPLRLVLTESVERPDDLNRLYGVAVVAMNTFRAGEKSTGLLRCEDLPERFFNPRTYPLEVMQALESAITHGSAERLCQLVLQIESLLTVDGAPVYYTRSVYFNTINLLINGLSKYMSMEAETLQELGSKSMLPRYTVREMVRILHTLSEKLASAITEKNEHFSPTVRQLQYIEENLSSSTLCLQAVADHAGLSASAFSRNFKECVGKTFKEYVDAARMNRARDMLEHTQLSIEQISIQVGYETLTSFYRIFKKSTELAPGEYRNAYKNSEQLENEKYIKK